jgi:hypothetical protein
MFLRVGFYLLFAASELNFVAIFIPYIFLTLFFINEKSD